VRLFYPIGGAGLLAAAAIATGVLTAGEVYPKPFDKVYAELSAMPLPTGASAAAGNGDVSVRHLDHSIEWHFMQQGQDWAVFTATLSPTDATHTRVKVDFRTGEAMDPQSSRLIATPYMSNMARLAMAEQVAAELGDRPFNRLRFGQLMAGYQAANPQAMEQLGGALSEMMNETAEQVRVNGAGTDSAEPQSPRESMDAATRPSTTFPSH